MTNKNYILLGAVIASAVFVVIFLLTLADPPSGQSSRTKDKISALQRTDESPDSPVSTSLISSVIQDETGEDDGNDVSVHQCELFARLEQLEASPHVRVILGLYPDQSDFHSRRSAMKKLNRDLAPDDIKALKLFLDFRYKDNSAERLLVFEGLKNDALDVLLRQDKLPVGTGIQLAEMFRDNEHSDVWRDYCIQYLTPYYQRRWPAGKQLPEDDSERKAIEETYWQATQQADKSFAGTALIGLDALSQTYTNIPREKVEQTAVNLARSDSSSEPTRITALIMASKMDRTEILPQARLLAQIGETPTLRMAAIAVLGRLGNEGDIELVSALSNSSEKRIAKTAESALQNLRKKNASPFTSQPAQQVVR